MINEKVERLLSLPKTEREELFREMAPGDQMACILFAPWEKRHEIIICAPDIAAVLASMPAEELFWTLKAAGPENAVLLLPYMPLEQLQFALDLDLWDRDALRPEKVVAWLLMMLEADPAIFMEWAKWITRQDEALLPCMLRPFIAVQKRPDDMDPQEAQDLLNPFTVDNSYYIGFRQEKLSPLFMNCLNLLVGDAGTYRDVMETILEETSFETLETAYRWRTSRLSDWGIPEYFESLEIFTPPPEGKVRKWNTSRCAGSEPYEEVIQPFVPTLYNVERAPAVSEAVSGLAGSPLLEEVLWQWTAAANKLLVAQRTDLDDPSRLREVLCDTTSLLNMGLEMERERSHEPREAVLATRVVEDLVRIATSRIMALKKKIGRLIQEGLIPDEMWPLPDEWREALEQMDWRTPALPQQLREEPSLARLTDLEGLTREITAWAKLFQRLIPHWSQWDSCFQWERMNLKDATEFTWPKALLTALVSHRLNGEAGINPVPASRLSEVKKVLSSLPHSTEEEVLPLLEGVLEPAEAKRVAGHLDGFVKDAWGEIKDVPDFSLDGRFMPFMLIDLQA